MARFEPDEIDFENQYDKLDPIDDDTSMTILNESIREQEELESMITIGLNGNQWIRMNE